MKHCLTLLALSLFLPIAAFAQRQVTCDSNYVPRPYQDCPGAIALCGAIYHAETNSICGEGLLVDEAVGSCGTQERVTSWYTFRATTSGLLSFYIQPNDVTDSLAWSSPTGQGDTDYDFLVFKLPAGATTSYSTCQLLQRDPASPSNQYELACNYSGQRGCTGLSDLPAAVNNARFGAPVSANAGDVFVMLVDNFNINTLGYTIRFFTPSNNPRYADVTQGLPLEVEALSYDPACTGNCPTLVRLNRAVSCQNLSAQVYDPANIGLQYSAAVTCGGQGAFSDSVWIVGNFNPLDSSLALVLSIPDSNSYLYQCTQVGVYRDTVLMRTRLPHQTTYITSNRTVQTGVLKVAPNPFTHQLSVTLPAGRTYSFSLLDATGKRVFHMDGLSGGQAQLIELPIQLPPGMYMAEASSQGKVFRQRLAK